VNFVNLWKTLNREPLAKEVNRKGIANPMEYAVKRIAPPLIVSSLPAKVRIAPKIGPTHGVHADPKEIPIKVEPR
jgi:hypothetical protein